MVLNWANQFYIIRDGDDIRDEASVSGDRSLLPSIPIKDPSPDLISSIGFSKMRPIIVLKIRCRRRSAT